MYGCGMHSQIKHRLEIMACYRYGLASPPNEYVGYHTFHYCWKHYFKEIFRMTKQLAFAAIELISLFTRGRIPDTAACNRDPLITVNRFIHTVNNLLGQESLNHVSNLAQIGQCKIFRLTRVARMSTVSVLENWSYKSSVVCMWK